MVSDRSARSVRRLAIVSTYLPRQCGIGTFAYDLSDALTTAFPALQCIVVPINDRPEGYDYSERARFELSDYDINSYRQAADFLNLSDIDLVLVQHEYGIFGGVAGSNILTLMRELQMPLVTTLHTVRSSLDHDEFRTMEEIVERSDRLVVMSQKGKSIMREMFNVPENKMDMIHHGVHDVPFVDPSFYKDQFGVEGRKVLLTFGLLSRIKGIEDVIKALPAIAKKHPESVYIILGATHPHVLREEGEGYRLSLEQLAKELGVAEHVIFHNRFVELEELKQFIGLADIYITPYLDETQITSGTLAYTVGSGKAIVSTPYWYAQELLAENRGELIPFNDPKALAERVNNLLDNEAERDAMRKRAYLYGRNMVWPKVAAQYIDTFVSAREHRAEHVGLAIRLKTVGERPPERPAIDLTHLRRLSDDTGILQHAIYTVPSYDEGYTTDDNARALIATVLLDESGHGGLEDVQTLAIRYLAFLQHAWNPRLRRFRNFLSYGRHWGEEAGSEDSHGRAVWALGTTARRSRYSALRDLASNLFAQALPATVKFTSSRAWAYSLIGVNQYLNRFPGDRVAREARAIMAGKLVDSLTKYGTDDWYWFEDSLTYANAKLPHALLVSGHAMGNIEMTEAALRALSWLAKVQQAEEGHFRPIGDDGFYNRGGVRAHFDQQPVEAQSMVAACLEAYFVTQERAWLAEAERAFAWFLGRNDLGLSLYDPSGGGCRDGLQIDRANQNQGAESTISCLLSLLAMRQADSYPTAATRSRD
ncbi:MAG: glycosyltransferase family 4 protein [Chloroflexi bacterium]|nr:glycosyltransferase family 4 protein [Chloroflexota bacterium]